MRIMVFDVPAESGGALSVLNEFYNEYKTDPKNNYIFVVSTPKLIETKNVVILSYPWVKKSWFHRIWFDYLVSPKLIRKYDIDEVMSLQNILIPCTRVPQTVYIHNSLPFSEYRFSIFEDKLLWIYQNVISKKIYRSIKSAKKIIVQAEWMKKACIDKLLIDENKIVVLPPKININVCGQKFDNNEAIPTFFYPASGMIFKNHKIVVNACKELKKLGITNYNVIFTLKGNENNIIAGLYKTANEEELPITFVGNLTREDVFKQYAKSILIFPSYIETIGLPLLETCKVGSIILSADCPYSREVLTKYKNAYFFNPFEVKQLSNLMEKIISNQITLK